MEIFKQECKLCDEIISDGNFHVIEEVKKSMFDTISLKLMLDDDTQNVMCAMCSSKLLAALNFKSTCLYADNRIIPYIGENKKPVNLKEMYARGKGIKQGRRFLHDWEICRLCLQPTGNDYKSIQEVPVDCIEIYIPEINFAVSTNPIICVKCNDALCVHSTFIRNCLDIEEKRKMNAANVGDMLLANPFIKMEEIEIKEENEEGDKSLHSQNGLIDTEEAKILYDLEDLKDANAESAVVSYENKECTSRTPSESNRKMKHPYSRESQVKSTGTDLKVQKYQCDKCMFKTRHRQSYIRHQLLHKDPLEVPVLQCDECDYTSLYKCNFKLHQLKHKDPSEVQMFKCDECDYKSIHKGSLTKHQLVHKDPSEVRMFQCDECDYKAIRKANLKEHQLIHKDPSEVRMFQCDECDYKSIKRYGLKRHQLRHKQPSELQMFKCDQCDYKTIRKDDLEKHQLRHKDPSEVRVFKCVECDYKSIRKVDLLKHHLKHKSPAEVQMYECDKCKFITKRKAALIKHCLKHNDHSESAYLVHSSV